MCVQAQSRGVLWSPEHVAVRPCLRMGVRGPCWNSGCSRCPRDGVGRRGASSGEMKVVTVDIFMPYN